jgi:hypothetical protein
MKALTLAAILLMAGSALISAAPDGVNPPETNFGAANLMAGKQKTDRTIFLEAIVAASPAEAFRLWTSRKGSGNSSRRTRESTP